MAIVSELLANGGVLPQLAAIGQKKPLFNKRNGVLFSAVWFIFFTMFMTSVWGIFGVDEFAALSAVTGFFGALVILIASLTLLPSSKKFRSLPVQENPAAAPMPAAFHSQPNAGALPPQQQQPATTYTAPHGSWRAPDTGDLVERGSVVEGTTKLLKRDE